MSVSVRVRALRDNDGTAARRIHATGEATVETEVPRVDELDASWIAGRRRVIEEKSSGCAGWRR